VYRPLLNHALLLSTFTGSGINFSTVIFFPLSLYTSRSPIAADGSRSLLGTVGNLIGFITLIDSGGFINTYGYKVRSKISVLGILTVITRSLV